MSVPAAYVGVILIWSTTPLAIRWSGDGLGFLLGVSLRMSLGFALVAAIIAVMRTDWPRERAALRVYAISGAVLFVAMTLVYWAARHVPTGWISLVFGLSPLVTGLLAVRYLDEAAPGAVRLTGFALAFGGLVLVFAQGFELDGGAVLGLAAVLGGVVVHCAGAVWLKSAMGRIPAISLNAGTLAFALPLWWLLVVVAGEPVAEVPPHALGAIAYLAIVGTALGFPLYFYVLRQVAASRVALITLVTPVIALALGAWLNDEPLGARVLGGAALVLGGLAVYQFGARRERRRAAFGTLKAVNET
ncbi:MAG: DMT family transporter [Chromatiales bacterium]|nr:DMT family transporter [Chromatiales bacterium]